MHHSNYLIIGSSHAALEALTAIRVQDPTASLTLITRDSHLPYSPTVLPYVVSGRSDADNVSLRNQSYFDDQAVNFITGRSLVSIDPASNSLTLDNGEQWQFDKLLLATGAIPIVPAIPGLDKTPFQVLRTLDDAIALRQGSAKASSAIVLGAGLVGMHGAENLAEAGLKVTIIEMQTQVLPGYFDHQAAAMIETAFNQHGVSMKMGCKAVKIQPLGDGGCRVELENGDTLEADLLLVSTGVKPAIEYCVGSGLETDQGILVDDLMTTNYPCIWAAGDVAQARDFYSSSKVVMGILPDAVEQGHIAGMAMSGDTYVKPYRGGVPINTYCFFGQHAISVGVSELSNKSESSTSSDSADSGVEIALQVDPDSKYFQKIILKNNQLQGISAINKTLDPGILWQLILRRMDLSEVKAEFMAQPLETSRRLMSETWR